MNKKKFISILLVFVLVLSNIGPVFANGGDTDNDVDFTGDVIYQIVTDRFYDGNSSNNPTGNMFSADKSNLRKYHGGDWQGIIDKINDGYLTDMGITAIWISQPVENVYTVLNDAAGTTAYHGYWARDFKKTNPYFGSMSDFENLIQVAHNNGMKVIIDFAPNHTSPASFDDPSYMENGKLYNNGNYINGYSDDTNDLFHHNGGTNFATIEDGIYRNLYDLADFNHQNPTVDNVLKEAIELWLDKGIDGIRVDAVKHMPEGWQKTFMDTIYSKRAVFTFGEWFLGVNEVDQANHDFANESGMSLLDFRYSQKIRQVLRDGTDNWYGFDGMISDSNNKYAEVIDQVTFVDNHDMDRFHKTGADTKNTDIALVVTLTSRGVPNIYYGTEQYMTGNGDPNNRGFMTSFDKTTNAYKIIKALSPLRQSNPALAYGTTEQRWINNDVYIYERKFGDDVVLVAVNKGGQDVNITGLKTALPQGTYNDEVGSVMNGNNITVNGSGDVTSFVLSSKEAAVWSYAVAETTPKLGHVGPMMGRAGQTVVINGEGFGSQMGSVKFGNTSAVVASWSDTEIKATVPSMTAGKYNVKVIKSGGAESNTYNDYEVLSGKQVSVRFIANNAYTAMGQNVYIVGNVYELGNWDPNNAAGPMYNQVIKQYPSWYFDVNVPEGASIQFKFIKKDGAGHVIWESGNNHYYTTPIDQPGTAEYSWQ